MKFREEPKNPLHAVLEPEKVDIVLAKAKFFGKIDLILSKKLHNPH
jgi:hypothetical protein